jgi:hypothetical protein
MNAPAHEPVASGPHQVVDVDGSPPTDLDDFVGEHRFVVERGGRQQQISGRGVLRGDGVRFHQKDPIAAGGKDIRVWRIDVTSDGGFVAEPEAAA